jgi:hypothetical protein
MEPATCARLTRDRERLRDLNGARGIYGVVAAPTMALPLSPGAIRAIRLVAPAVLPAQRDRRDGRARDRADSDRGW